MQCRLCLETFYENVKEKETPVVVLYNCSNDRHNASYETLKKEFPKTKFVKENNFKNELLHLVENKTYVLFVVDDCIFCHPFSICECTDILRLSPLAIGFSLRLGTNTTNCYPVSQTQKVPDHMRISGNKMLFNWQTSEYDFKYPLEVSSSIYKVETIQKILVEGDYANPNTLEWLMANNLHMYSHKPLLLSYITSIAFCNPINKIQTSNNNRSGSNLQYSPDSLLTEFEKYGKISPIKFKEFISNGAHEEVEVNIVYS